MIANRSPQRRTLWLAPLFALVVGGGLLAAPAPVLAHEPGRDCAGDCDRHDRPRRDCDCPDAECTCDKKQPAKAAAKKKADKAPPPELPNLPHAIAVLAHDTRIGKFLHHHENWYVARPLFALLVVLLALLVLGGVYRRRSVMPGRLQTGMEMVVEAMENLVVGVLGREEGRRYLPFLGGLFLYILCLNVLGLFPLAMSPTSSYATTGALAFCTLTVTQYTYWRRNGVKGVLLHWLSNPTDPITWVIGIIFVPLHIFSDLVVKPLSLLLRLWGNIYGEDVLLGSMLMLGIGILSFLPEHGIPVGLPLQLPFMFLAMLTSTIQALVFALLSTIYIMLVLPHEDHDEHHEEAHAHA